MLGTARVYARERERKRFKNLKQLQISAPFAEGEKRLVRDCRDSLYLPLLLEPGRNSHVEVIILKNQENKLLNLPPKNCLAKICAASLWVETKQRPSGTTP